METRISPENPLPAGKLVTEIALLLQQAVVGHRFHPTEEELINYLKWKVTGCRETLCIIPTLENIYEINPWDLPAKFNEKSIIRSRDQEWWFICPQTQNQRISRKTPCGFSWKITGKHKDIKAKNDDKKIGSKITLVFPDDRNSKGAKSPWVMHEVHPHPDDTSFVLYCLKMKQDEKADNQEPSIQISPAAGCVLSGEQADKSFDRMDCDNPGQLPLAEHHVQEMQNQLNDLIMNGSSSSTEVSSGSCCTVSNEGVWFERLMSPDSFPYSDIFNFKDPISETEADVEVIQYGQLGETSWDNLWANKNQRPVCDILEGAVPLEEEEGFVEQKLNYPQNTEKIITECTSSVGAPAKAKAANFKEEETTMIQPQKKKDDVKMESDNISRWETWNDSLSLTRSTVSTSCRCRNKSTIDPRVLLAKLITVVLVAYLIVDGICRISDGINETLSEISMNDPKYPYPYPAQGPYQGPPVMAPPQYAPPQYAPPQYAPPPPPPQKERGFIEGCLAALCCCCLLDECCCDPSIICVC
ncbi:hypothetical protein NL676_039086 [Syzygium grande]|nr:hypothetical protein NL676_039086 [Syzygium grande]